MSVHNRINRSNNARKQYNTNSQRMIQQANKINLVSNNSLGGHSYAAIYTNATKSKINSIQTNLINANLYGNRAMKKP